MSLEQKIVRANSSNVANGSQLHQPSWMRQAIDCELQFLYIWENQRIDAQELEESLAQVLSLYPAVAGRIANQGKLHDVEGCNVFTINFVNEGVPFTVAEGHAGAASDVPSGVDGPPLGKFADFPSVAATKGGPLLTVKLTLFSEGGCVLGLTMTHGVFDAWTFGCFMRDWSAIHCGQLLENRINVAPHEILRAASSEESRKFVEEHDMVLVMSGWMAKIASTAMSFFMRSMLRKMPQERCVIHFSDNELRRLKTGMQEKAGTWLSTNEALMAHMHPLMLDAFGVPRTGKLGAMVPVNLRGKVPGVAATAVGNNIGIANCVYTFDDDKTEHLAARIHEEMRAKLSEESLLQSVRFANWSVDSAKFHQCQHLKQGARGVINQWNYQVTTPYFEVDFGVGKPTRAQPWSCEPVKVMRSLHGGVDVMVWKGSWGIASWASDKHAMLTKGLSLVQVSLAIVPLFLRKLRSRHYAALASVALAASVLIKSAFGRAQRRYVDSCFRALEEDPRLRSFPKSNDSIACGGA